MSERRFATLETWMNYLGSTEIPVLRHTAREIEDMRTRIDNVSGREVAKTVLSDPTMTLRVLSFIQEAHHVGHLRSEITTIDRSVMMLGIHPFFAKFENLPVIEDHLKTNVPAMLGVLGVIRRAQRAAQFAQDWAYHRHDLDIQEITVAALLHSIAELMVWIHAPGQALEIRQLLQTDRTLRSYMAQQQVLGFSGRDMQYACIKLWRLPQLLGDLMNDRNADHPRVQNVVHAVNLARHLANGWDDAALPDDYRAITKLLHVSYQWLLSRIGHPDPDAEAARMTARDLEESQHTDGSGI